MHIGRTCTLSIIAMAASLALAQDPLPQQPPPQSALPTAVATGTELSTKIAELQAEFDRRSRVNEVELANALKALQEYKAELKNEATSVGDLKVQVTLLANTMERYEKARLTREKDRRRFEIKVLRTKLEAVSRCVGFMGSYARGIGGEADAASLQLRFGNYANVSAISPTFVDKVRKLGKNVPSLESVMGSSGQLGSNPIFAVGVGLINLILPKKKPQVISDVEDVLSVADALVVQRELSSASSARFAALSSSAHGVTEASNEFFIGLESAFSSTKRLGPENLSYISRTQLSQEILLVEFSKIEQELEKLAEDQSKENPIAGADPEARLVLIRSKADSLQRKASSLLGLFKPVVGDLKRVWEYQATGIDEILRALERTIVPGEDAKKTARFELKLRLIEWAKEARMRSTKVSTDYEAEVKALEGLIIG